ncbi:hypothetical protein [Ideonella benzenivorans]|nr:hypothetical protein [Ideonella benzenivorans]
MVRKDFFIFEYYDHAMNDASRPLANQQPTVIQALDELQGM